MRDPIYLIYADTMVTLYSGSRFQGSGNPGNQTTGGSTLFYRKSGDRTQPSRRRSIGET